MKVLVVADWHGSEIYAEVFAKSFEELGNEVRRFSWKEYFKHYQYSERYKTDNNRLKSIYYRFQNKFIFGPDANKINYDLIDEANSFKPDLVFIYRGTHIYPSTINKIKNNTKCKVFGYNNDDPFSPRYPKYFWRHFLNSVPLYDHIFCYREHNIREFLQLGNPNASLLRSYYTSERNFKIDNIKKIYDIVFIGHFEDDGRDSCMLELLQSDYSVKLFGTGWEKSSLYHDIVRLNGEIFPVYDDYNLVLNQSKIALVFLSKLNRDTYTRRCFEIPATGTMMISEFTDDLTTLYEPGVEADFFQSKSELIGKIENYLSRQELISEIGEAGRVRLISDGHEIIDRAKQVIREYHKGS
ncbi:glycosyltransferase [Vibrio vulnificus]|nr:glycosyltransferase [Vibrio vulnificus]ELT7699165.1 glycosyltransferase [Vibrio vulnificus]MCU8383368.1 glycosyltransferase [Vibrio vulnificus]